ncbi:MAG: glutaredoxin family protein [Candidatus Methanoperedens sp.]|jgi:glutaredoxin-like protein NrdH|nr:glutaredoxin family protein [Candidatus Methanoperedens sp.]PKL54194.1 MAG: glutaredoxin family protein [Candidatus Methanoperedenaceae archaeon HGW-Methanoperedenaceae-1]
MNKTRPKLYTLSTCVHCKATKNFLKENGIGYDYVDVDMLAGSEREKVISEVMELTGTCRFPTIIVGKRVILGFREDELREALEL